MLRNTLLFLCSHTIFRFRLPQKFCARFYLHMMSPIAGSMYGLGVTQANTKPIYNPSLFINMNYCWQNCESWWRIINVLSLELTPDSYSTTTSLGSSHSFPSHHCPPPPLVNRRYFRVLTYRCGAMYHVFIAAHTKPI